MLSEICNRENHSANINNEMISLFIYVLSILTFSCCSSENKFNQAVLDLSSKDYKKSKNAELFILNNARECSPYLINALNDDEIRMIAYGLLRDTLIDSSEAIIEYLSAGNNLLSGLLATLLINNHEITIPILIDKLSDDRLFVIAVGILASMKSNSTNALCNKYIVATDAVKLRILDVFLIMDDFEDKKFIKNQLNIDKNMEIRDKLLKLRDRLSQGQGNSK